MNSREKGKRGERRWRDMLRDAGFLKAHRGVQYQGTSGSPDVQCPELPGIHFEVKHVERLNIWEAMAQAARDSGAAKTPVVAHTRNRSGWLVTMRAEDWLDLLRRSDFVAPSEISDLKSQIAAPPQEDAA
ncbi:MAG: putative PDDEXK endonuclease [Opitutaceae bacterium]